MSSDRAAQLVEAGIWLKLSGDREGARKLFERALKLDPGNTKAAQLLAGAPAPGEEPAPPAEAAALPVPPTVSGSAASNPFERTTERSATDWGAAAPEAPPTVSLDSDWGRLTGAATPVPYLPPSPAGAAAPAPFASSSSNVVLGEAAPAMAAPARVPPRTMQFTAPGPAPRTTLQLFGAPPVPPPEPGAAPKTTAMLFAPSPDALLPLQPDPVAPSGLPEPGTRSAKKTMQFVRPAELLRPQPLEAPSEAAPSGLVEPGGRVSKTLQFATSGAASVQTETFDFSPVPLEPVPPAAPGLAAPRSVRATQQFGGAPAAPPPAIESETFDFSVQPVPLAPAPAPAPAQPAARNAKTMQFTLSAPLVAPRSLPLQPEAFDFGLEPLPLPAATPTGLPEDSRFSGSEMPLFGPPQRFDAPEPIAARTIELGGDPGPEAPPSSTPPLFGYGALAGHVPTPSPSTPPLFAPLPMAAPAPRGSPGESAPAWTWSNAAHPPATAAPTEAEPEPLPTPRPSPLMPRATSAWDQRSNPGIKLETVMGPDRALELLSSDSKITRSPEARKEEIQAILRGARDLLDLDDHSGAMELIVKAQEIAPDDPDVLAMRERSEKTLLNMFESKLGKMETVPRVLLKDDEIIWLNLDHRAGFVLAQIDGTVTFDDLFSVSGMSRIDTARILAQLVEEGVISRG